MQTRVRTKYSQEPEIKVRTQSQENRNSSERNRNSEDKVLLPLGIHSKSQKKKQCLGDARFNWFRKAYPLNNLVLFQNCQSLIFKKVKNKTLNKVL